MKIQIRFQLASQPVIHENVKNTYEKGSFFCVMLSNNIVYKYPIATIFDVKETPVDPI